MQSAFAEIADFYRIDASLKLDPKKRSGLGQYMTPVSIGRFMASLFDAVSGEVRLLDPGAGVGSLSAAFIERCSYETKKPRSVSLDCYEIEPVLIDHLESTLKEAEIQGRATGIDVTGTIHTDDFILSPAYGPQADLFQSTESGDEPFTHVIMNPPYKKIHSASAHRSALRRAGIETSNLYTGFMFLAALRLTKGGEMVAIVPRSFCNGPYFKPFREQFFSLMNLRHVHVFEKRDSAFEDDEVLQENIIIHAVRGGASSKVRITTSRGGAFAFDPESQECVGEDMTQTDRRFCSRLFGLATLTRLCISLQPILNRGSSIGWLTSRHRSVIWVLRYLLARLSIFGCVRICVLSRAKARFRFCTLRISREASWNGRRR